MFFFSEILKNKDIVISLALQDFKQRYVGNYLGTIWAFVGPLATILILFFIFQFGFRASPSEGVPFILWLTSGMIPWFFITEAISSGSNSILDKPYLVKKVVFNVFTLPLTKLISAILIHSFFIIIIMCLLVGFGYFPKLHWIQLFYYLFAAVVLILGITWITSALVIFIRDLIQMIGILLQFGFWLTPIIWSEKVMPEKYLVFLKLNPTYYIVQGYRDSLLFDIWFWEKPILTIYFWCITLFIFIIGIVIFKKLRPHFADVL